MIKNKSVIFSKNIFQLYKTKNVRIAGLLRGFLTQYIGKYQCQMD